MNTIYEKIIQQLNNNEAAFTDAGLIPIKHIDKFRGQYLNPEAHEIFATPAIFYKWQAAWSNIGNGIQRGDVAIDIHIVLDNYHSAASGSSDYVEALKIDKYYEVINSLLHGLSGKKFTPLQRTADQPDEQPTQLIVHITSYSCKYTDNTASYLNKISYTEINDLSLQKEIRKPTYSIDVL